MFSIIKRLMRNLKRSNRSLNKKIGEKGVSLISLIVTIIVLLILAGVTIRISSGNSGIIKRAKKSVAMYQNASENESETLNDYARELKTFIEVPKATTIKFTPDVTGWTSGDVTVTAEAGDKDYEIELKSDDSDWAVRKDNKITVTSNQQITARLKNKVDKYSEDVATYNVTNIDKEAPDKTAPALSATTNSITVTFKQKDKISGIAKREYSIDNGATWEIGSSVYTFNGLTQGKKYTIITRATDKATNQSISDIAYITTGTIPAPVVGSNLTFTAIPSGWTNGNVSVAVSTTVTGYTLQTSTDGKTWGTTNPLTYSANGIAYARLWDGNNASAVATTNITNIDKLAPTNTAPTVATITNKITITNKQVDANAGNGSGKSDLNPSKTQYRLVTNTSGTTAVTGKDWQSSNVFSELTQNTTYYVQTKVTDNAGNTTISAVATVKTATMPTPTAGGNVIFTPTPSNWTNGNVNVTVSTTVTDLMLQTSTDGKTWGTTNPLTYTANGTAYARLWDGNNASAVATTNVTNIDKLAPINTAPTVATTTNKITITNKQVDANAGNGSGKSDLNPSKTQYRLVTNTNGTTAITGKDWQSSNVFNGLTQNTTYYVQTKVTDNAGNTTVSAVATAKTAIVPSGTTAGVITLTPDHNTWTNTDVKVSATTNQTGYTIQMSTDGKTFKDGTTVTLTSNGTVYARLRDSSNNYGASASISISIIDKVAPTKPTYKALYDDGKTAYTSGTWTNKHVKTDISSTDANSGINRIEYSFDKNSWTKFQFGLSGGLHQNGTTYTGTESWGLNNRNDTVYFRAIDNAGNISEISDSFNIRYDIEAPTTTAPTATTKTNSITVTNKQTDALSGIASIQYQIKKNSDTTWGSLQSSGTFNGLTQNTKYNVRTHAVDKAGNASDSAVTTVTTGTIPGLTTGSNLTFTATPSGWTNGNVSVKVATTITGYTLQTSTDGKTWGTTNPLTYSANGTAYARLWDGNNASAVATTNITNIDKIAPTNTAPTVATTTNKIIITNKQVDENAANGSGKSDLNSSKTQYRLVTSADGTTAITGKDWQASNVFSGLTQNTTYYVQTKVTDNAGNTTVSAVTTAKTGTIPGLTTGSNLTFTPTPSGWTNGNVSVAVSTTVTGYTLQTSTDGKTWGTTNPLTYSANGTAYARLWDGNNASAVATTNITNIDKIAPTNTAPTVATTTNKIIITNKQVDENAANGSGKSDLNSSKTQYRLVTSADGTTAITGKDWQASNVFSGLTQNTTYYVQTKVTDNAGNTTVSAVTTAKTTIVPSGTTSGVITLTPDHTSWTNTDVKVTATTSQSEYTIQMSTDGKTFADGTSVTLTGNGTVYARLRDSSNNYGASASLVISIIDKLSPTNTEPTVAITTNKITATLKQVDENAANGSGKSDLNSSKTQYRLVTNTNGTTAVSGKDWQASNVFSGLTQNTTYYVQTKVTDNAGNTTTSAVATAKTGTIPGLTTGSNLTFTPTPSGWTNGNVSVAVSTTVTGYTLQTSTDGKTWGTTNPLIYTANGTAYARLWDGNNASAVATTNVTNIDKTAPSFNATISNVSSTGYDVIITGVSDTQSGVNRIQCPTWTELNGQDDLDYSWQTSDKSKATKQSDGSYKFRVNITDHKNENGKYITHVYGYDNVGNNMHLVLNATVPAVTITWNANGGTVVNATSGKAGNAIGTLPTTTRTGYTFAGWFTAASGGTQITTTSTYPTSGNVTYYAHWIAKNYTVTYNANGGTGAPANQTATYDSKFTVSTTQPTRAGYTFSGWKDPTGDSSWTNWSGTWKYDNGQYGITNNTLTLTAQWTPKTYTVTYNANGGTGAPANQIATYDSKFTVSTTQPTRAGYTFSGWKDPTGDSSWTNWSGTWKYDNGQYGITNNTLTLTANWQDKTAPTTTAPTATTKTNSITVTNRQTDNGTGIASIQYQIKKNGTSTWGSLQSSATFSGLTQNTKYDVRTHAVDKAGNASDSAVITVTTGTVPGLTTGSNLTFTATPSGWTNGNVSVKVATTITGYTLQTSTDGKTWGTTNPLTYSTNGTAYARLWDGNNASAVATTNITNIDKTAPTISISGEAGDTSVKINATTSDSQSGINSSSLKYKIDNGTWQTSNVFYNLDSDKTYTFVAQVTDNAGNTKESNKISAKPLGGVFAKLYDTNSDGTGDTLTFGNKSNFAYNGTLKEYYGNIKENHQSTIPWDDSSKNITKVEFVTEVKPHYTANWFYNFEKLNTIKSIKNLNTSNVTDMRSMFYYCSSLTSLDLSNFNTSKVTDMSSMFYYCSSLTSLDLSNFSTSKVTNMSYMFSNCSGLTSLNVSNFNTSNVTDMGSMFSNCSGLTSLDVSSFDTSNVTNMGGLMSGMFSGCSSLTSLDLSNFNTSNVTDMSSMFSNCSGLTSLDLSNFNTSKVTNMGGFIYGMFYGCSSLTSLDLSNFNTSNVTDMGSMFSNCSGLTSLNLSNFNTSKVTDMSFMFSGCKGLTSLNVSNFNTSKVTNMNDMFDSCSSLTSLDLSNFNTSKVTNMHGMFWVCQGLTSLDLSNFNTSNVTDMVYMFTNCKGLTSLNLSNFNTSNVTDMDSMFSNCSGLTSLNLSNFNTSKVTDMSFMFSGCKGLTSLNVSNFNTSKVTDMSTMFMVCSKLTSLDVRNFNTSNVTNMGYMFSSCKGLTSLNVSNFNTSKVTNMSEMFSSCEGLTSLDVSSFDTSNVTDMSSMFSFTFDFWGNSKLTTIYVDSNKWSTKNVTNSYNMFQNCSKLKGQRGTVYSSSHVDASYAKVDGGTSNPGYLTQK